MIKEIEDLEYSIQIDREWVKIMQVDKARIFEGHTWAKNTIKEIDHNVFEVYDNLGTRLHRCHFDDRNVLHHDDEPALITYHRNGAIKLELCFNHGKLHHDHDPAFCLRDEDENISVLKYFHKNKLHREKGPAQLVYCENGYFNTHTWLYDDKIHRLGGPAIIRWNGVNKVYEVYKQNGVCHSLENPAFIKYDNRGNIISTKWYIMGKMIDTDEYPEIPFNEWPLTEEAQLRLKLLVENI